MAQKQKCISNWEEVPVLMDAIFASRLLGINPTIIRKMCRDGELPSKKVGTQWRIPKEELRKYINE